MLGEISTNFYVEDMIEFTHSIQNTIGAGQLFAFAHWIHCISSVPTFVMEPEIRFVLY